MPERRVHFIDANIPMDAVGRSHPLKSPAVAILETVDRGDLRAVTDAEVLQEILHRYTALRQR
jgi:predicted nucleic acid-binding protein